MYEVILTFRPDFIEMVAGRYATEDEAREAARLLSSRPPVHVLRIWVRHAREAETMR